MLRPTATVRLHVRLATLIAAAASILLVAGCAYQVEYAPAHLEAARRAPAAVLDGKVLLVVAQSDADYVYEGHPASFTGGATSLKIPLGRIAREAASMVYGDRFRGGVETVAAPAESLAGYRLVVRPRLLTYNYGYYQLKNLGLAVTPGVEASIRVDLLGADGQVAWTKQYDSGPIEGERWMMTGQPAERINRITHKAPYDLMERSAADVIGEMKRREAPRASDG